MSALAALALVALASVAEDRREAALGRSARIDDLVLHGPELAAAPAAPDAAVIVRVVAVRAHGSDFRYDLEWTAFVPGEHDLAQHLVRTDGAPAELPPIPVVAHATLPAGTQRPHAPVPNDLPSLGGYRTWLVVAGVGWLAGLAALLLSGRRRRAATRAAAPRPRTLAERLAPLVERAARGELSSVERAQLEASLLAWWRARLALENERPERAHALLRGHPEAGPLLAKLEEWLHRPGSPERVDVSLLLAPYRDLPPDALELPAAAG